MSIESHRLEQTQMNNKVELLGTTPGEVQEVRERKSDAGRSQLEVLRQKDIRYQAAVQYREAYLSFLNQQRLEERRFREGLTTDPRKRQRAEKHITDNKSKKRQTERNHIDAQNKQSQIEKDNSNNQGKQPQIDKDLINELLNQLQIRKDLPTDKMIERLLRNDKFAQLLEENRDKLFNKSNFEGTNDGKEKADFITSKTPSSSPHIKNPNPSDPLVDGISTKQPDSTTSKDRSSFKTSTREGINPQWHGDQAANNEKSKFVHGFDQNDSKSTGSDATTHSGAWEYSKQQSAKADQKFASTDDLYRKEEAVEVISAFFESKEGKIMLVFEQEFARTQKEFFESGAARVDGEKVGIDNPQKMMKSMQREIDECRLMLANVIDPKRVQLGEVQKEEYYRCLKDLASHLITANAYMQDRIDATRSKTKSSPNMSQWSDKTHIAAAAA
jgi:hypothetical protein